MKWFLDLTTRSKLLFAFAVMLGFLGAVIATAYSGIDTLLASQRELYADVYTDVRDMARVRTQFSQMRVQMLEAQLLKVRSDQEPLLRQAAEGSKLIDQTLAGLRERNRGVPQVQGRLDELNTVWDAFAHTKDTEIIPLILAGKTTDSQRLAVGVQQDRAVRIRALDEELVVALEERMRGALGRSEAEARQDVQLFATAGVTAVAAGLLMAILLTRLIAAPLKDIAGRATQIAEGDIAVRPPGPPRGDEIGLMEDKFNQMAASLADKAEATRRVAAGDLTVAVAARSERDVLGVALAAMVERLRRITEEIREGVEVLASSSAEILSTTTQVASGAEETAAAVTQTTATMEEVKQTAHLAVDKAKQVAEEAQRTQAVSESGSRAVAETIERMHGIASQMGVIADAIVALSEQGQAIGEIIATVNDLAEQSAILAVNAAVEAAKAGEQGKGFAVVAQEVKSLAEQSKQATAQVRSILGDVQKATSRAVLATEQGNKAVEAGVALSTQLGESIQALAESIAAAAGAATQIAVSAQQQLAGMDQAVLAVQNIRDASAQNVAGTRQADGAARNLHELGLKLKQLLEIYRV